MIEEKRGLLLLMSLLSSTCYLVFLLPWKINVFELELGVTAKQRMPGINVLQARHSLSLRPVLGDKSCGLLRLINGRIHTNTLPRDLLPLSLSLTSKNVMISITEDNELHN